MSAELASGAPALADMVSSAFSRGLEAKAIRYHGVWYDWDWMRTVADRISALLEAAGVREDQAIAIAPANQPACAAALLALIAQRREIVMIYAYQSPEALARKVAELNCAAVLAENSAWQEPLVKAAAHAGSVGISLSIDGQSLVPGTEADPARGHRIASAERGINLLTSGTTGPPKLHHLTYDLIRRSMVLESPMHPFGTPPSPVPFLHSSAFGNISGLYSWLPLVVADRPVIMTEKFDLDEYLDYVREFHPLSAGFPPSVFREVLDRDVPVETFANMKYMSAGASAMDHDLQRDFQAKYDVTILHSYGATETGGVVAMVTPDLIEQYGPEKAYSVGKPCAGAEFRIVDPETGEELPPDQPGVLHIKVPRIGPDWMVTSDVAKLDEDGFLYYVGRNDGAIVRGGFKIDPQTIRKELLTHPAILDAIVAGAPDRRLQEVPVTAYVVKSGMQAPSADELKAYLRERLPATFLPVGYRQVEQLPFTPTEKPDLGAVRAMFAQGQTDSEMSVD